MGDVKIKQVHFAVEITEPVGPLSVEDVRKIATLVLETLENRKQHDMQRNRDTRVRDRVWDPDQD